MIPECYEDKRDFQHLVNATEGVQFFLPCGIRANEQLLCYTQKNNTIGIILMPVTKMTKVQKR